MMLFMELGVITVEWSQSPVFDSNVESAPTLTSAKNVKPKVTPILSSKSE